MNEETVKNCLRVMVGDFPMDCGRVLLPDVVNGGEQVARDLSTRRVTIPELVRLSGLRHWR